MTHHVIVSMLDDKSGKAISEDVIKKERKQEGYRDKARGKLDNNACLLCLIPPKNHHNKDSLKKEIKMKHLLEQANES